MYARVETETLDEMTDAELIRRFKHGDDEALATLLTRHNDALYRFCCHLVPNRQDAEDICQESLTRAIDRVDTLKAGSAFRSWLFRIARNLSIDAFRQQRRVCPLPEEDVTPEELHTDGPHEVVEVGEERYIVAEALRRLTQNHQKVLLLREVEGLSYAEISRRLDLSQSAVETLLFRARRRLREEYGKTAVALPGLALVSGLPALAARLAAPLSGGMSLLGKVALTAAVIGGTAASVPHLFPRSQRFTALQSTHHLAVFQPIPAHLTRPATGVRVVASRLDAPRPAHTVAVREHVAPRVGLAVRPMTAVGSRTMHVTILAFGHSVFGHSRAPGLIAVGQRFHSPVAGARHAAPASPARRPAASRSGDRAVPNPASTTPQIAAGPAGEVGTTSGGALPSNRGATAAGSGADSPGSSLFSSPGAASEGSLPGSTDGPAGASTPATSSVGLASPVSPTTTSLPPMTSQQPTALSTQPDSSVSSPSAATANRPGAVAGTGRAGGPGASVPSTAAPPQQEVGSSSGQAQPSLNTTDRP